MMINSAPCLDNSIQLSSGRNIAILIIVIAEMLICGRSFARINELDERFHYSQCCGFPSVCLRRHGEDINMADSANVFIKCVKVVLWDAITDSRGEREEITSFNTKNVGYAPWIGRYGNALDIGIPASHKFNEFPNADSFARSPIVQNGQGASAQPPAKERDDAGKDTSCHKLVFYALLFGCGFEI